MSKVNFAKRTFQKIDTNNDGKIDKGEVKKHLSRVGVGAGLFGLVHSKASQKFLDTFDSNRDGKVSWNEFKGKAGGLLPPSVKDSTGRISPARASKAFRKMDKDRDGKISVKEMKAAIRKSLPPGTSYKGIVSDIAAKLGVNALDVDGDRKISLAEFKRALREANVLLKGSDK